MKRGQKVVDLGCWPGGWLQVAAREVGPKGRVLGVDKAAVDPPLTEPNISSFVGDIETPEVCERILEIFGGRADVILSDAAPKLTGIRTTDRALEEQVLEALEATIPRVLRTGGRLLAKILDGPEAQIVDRRIRQMFERAKTVKTKVTRKGSRERYLFASGYRGVEALSIESAPQESVEDDSSEA
jgi:23S rRNA (uridine2552-2'-O)-methyltransferase